MFIQCTNCDREFDVDIAHAARRFRCPYCGQHFRFPGTSVSSFRGNHLVVAGEAEVQETPTRQIQVRTYQERTSMLLVWATVVVALSATVSIFLMLATLREPDITTVTTSNPQYATLATVSVPPAVAHTLPTAPTDPVSPAVAGDYYKTKAPIEMTQSEWVMTLRDWGELPTWWFHWPYEEERPWTYPLSYQDELFREVSRLEKTSQVTETKIQELRRRFVSAQRQYPPQPENSPHDLVDKYLRGARYTISRELMQQHLDHAGKLLRSMLGRGANYSDQSTSPQ